MRIADFITRDMQSILEDWDRFAASQLPAAASMDSAALRDHAEEMLAAFVRDIQKPQSESEQSRKAKGAALRLVGAPETAAESHAYLRGQSGFDINQMIAEYRALRANVLSLWLHRCKPEGSDLEDMIRFNEAIDQAVAESVAFFGSRLNHERNLLLGTMGHDMRDPLHVILMAAQILSNANAGPVVVKAAGQIAKSGAQLNALLGDLIDYNRTNLGLGFEISTKATNLAEIFEETLDQLRMGHPGHPMQLECTGETTGIWDPHRLDQLLRNLVINAIKHGTFGLPIRVSIVGAPSEIRFSVHNRGQVIESTVLREIFSPLVKGEGTQPTVNERGSLGLGLYIARQIALAHGGEISARSDESETAFIVRLPRLAGSNR